MKVCKAN